VSLEWATTILPPRWCHALAGTDLALCQDFDEAIRLDPRLAEVYYDRGIAYILLGQYERAIQDFDEAIRLDPRSAKAYYMRGWAYESLGKSKEAGRDLAKAKELEYPPRLYSPQRQGYAGWNLTARSPMGIGPEHRPQ